MDRLQIYFFLCLFVLYADGQDETSKVTVKRSYGCPGEFIRLGNRCYYFGREELTWHEAYFKCRDLHGNLAIIRTPYQNKLITHTLRSISDKSPSEWWLGGLYDWKLMTWKWAASGKNVTYSDFSHPQPEDKEELRWNCIAMDPRQQFLWSWNSCLKRERFICHTKLKIVTKKYRKKPESSLNEILLPDELAQRGAENLKDLKPLEPSNDLNALPAHKPKPLRKKGRGRKGKRRRKQMDQPLESGNGTLRLKQGRNKKYRPRRYKHGDAPVDTSLENLKWKNYHHGVTLSPLHPREIVEEFVYSTLK